LQRNRLLHPHGPIGWIGTDTMPLYFQSICSSSSGNCLTLWSDTSRIVIDCGLSSMKQTRQALAPLAEQSNIDAVLLTHTHGDHVSYYPLRVLEEMRCPVYVGQDCIEHLKAFHFNEYVFPSLNLHACKSKPFTAGDFLIKPFGVPHHPAFATVGFEIFYQDKKAVIATDFCAWESILDKFIDADFIFVESNHDLALLEQYYNPNSRYHLPNPAAAGLLIQAVKHSKKPPRQVMLGHLSSQRNTAKLALCETAAAFKKASIEMPFALTAAPLREKSHLIQIA